MMQNTASGSSSQNEVAAQLHQVVDRLNQQLPNPKNCQVVAAGTSTAITAQQLASLTASW